VVAVIWGVAGHASRGATVPKANAGMGMTVFTTATRTKATNRASPGIGIAFSVLWVLLETPSIDILILFSLDYLAYGIPFDSTTVKYAWIALLSRPHINTNITIATRSLSE